MQQQWVSSNRDKRLESDTFRTLLLLLPPNLLPPLVLRPLWRGGAYSGVVPTQAAVPIGEVAHIREVVHFQAAVHNKDPH